MQTRDEKLSTTVAADEKQSFREIAAKDGMNMSENCDIWSTTSLKIEDMKPHGAGTIAMTSLNMENRKTQGIKPIATTHRMRLCCPPERLARPGWESMPQKTEGMRSEERISMVKTRTAKNKCITGLFPGISGKWGSGKTRYCS